MVIQFSDIDHREKRSPRPFSITMEFSVTSKVVSQTFIERTGVPGVVETGLPGRFQPRWHSWRLRKRSSSAFFIGLGILVLSEKPSQRFFNRAAFPGVLEKVPPGLCSHFVRHPAHTPFDSKSSNTLSLEMKLTTDQNP